MNIQPEDIIADSFINSSDQAYQTMAESQPEGYSVHFNNPIGRSKSSFKEYNDDFKNPKFFKNFYKKKPDKPRSTRNKLK